MNKKEFLAISTGLKAAYPRFTFLSTDSEMEFWYQMLQDIDYPMAHNAVLEHIGTNTFPPSIADIRRLCTERCMEHIKSFDEAWGTVQKAIQTCGWENPYAAFDMMDDITVEIVKNLGWRILCLGENPEANRANFRDAYKEKAREKQSQMQLPVFVSQNKAKLIEQYVPEKNQVKEKITPRIEVEKPVTGNGPPEHLQQRINELLRR